MSSSVPHGHGASGASASAAARIGDQELVGRLRAGDVAAFEAVFRRYYVPLCGFVAVYTGSAEAAEELVQDVFASLWERRQQLELRSSLEAYLHGAARNRALSRAARSRIERRWAEAAAQRRRVAVPLDRSGDADAKLWAGELGAVVHRIVARMPERRRLVYMLSRDRHMSYAEIAEALGIAVKTVETQIGRALKDLRDGLIAGGWVVR